ncbi:uncharacterized protein LOC130522542 isoform X2 [Takifugu flavidus]|uniref:uncharacterized protein LOC130522542 isoform X2 n=1 Tax=Takifugu flavidus TaxID=433684 RepID=UPI0025442D73|nr:uncharacterized protein LOC130522542 isoform X2 [Takifugu flavidus]
MSHPPYNPCGSRKQRSAQGQYDYSNTQPEAAHLGADFSFSSSAVPERSGTIVPSLTSLNYRHEQRRIVNDEPILRSAITNSTRDREVRAAGIPVPQTNQNAPFPGRDTGEIGPFGTNKASLHMSSSSSAFQGDGGTCVVIDRCSLDWLNYKRPPNQSTSATSHGEEHNAPYIPGLGDDNHIVPEERSAAPPSSQTRDTAETATSILRQYGLDKEDLEYLISCPEDQMTLANMQKILQQRSLEKANKTMAASHTKTYPEPQPLKSLSGPYSHSSSVGPGLSQKRRSPAVLQQSKVIDYGHKRRYNEGASDGVGTTADGPPSSSHSGGTFLLDSGHSGGSRQQPQEKNKRGTNSDSSGSLHILNTLGPYNKPLQTPEKVPSTMLVPKTDTDMRKSTRAVPVKEPEDGQSPLKPATSCVLMQGLHSGRPGLISDNKSHSIKAKQDQAPTVGNQAGQHPLAQQSQPHMPTEPLMRTVVWSSGYSASLQLPPATTASRISEASWATHHSPGIPPHLHQPFPAQAANPEERTRGKATPFKGLPTLAMMHDYAATSPRVFPHTCSLCSKECAGMKDWIAHQNTSLHLGNCKLLRHRYPDWDGTIKTEPRSADKNVKPSTATAADVRQKAVRGSRSRSHSASPRRHGLEGKRERHSRSRSPQSSRYTLRSPDKPASCRWIEDSPRWMNVRHSPPKRRCSPPLRWSDDRGLAPRRDDGRLSPLRRNDKRPERIDERRHLHMRSEEREKVKTKSLGNKNDDRRTSPRRTEEKWLSSRRVVERHLSPRAVERRLSAETLSRLEASGVQSNHSDLDTMVKNLASALVAEIKKITPASSSPSSSSSKAGKQFSLSLPATSLSSVVKKSTLNPLKSKPFLQKSGEGSSRRIEVGKSGPPTMVKLEGITNSLSHHDINTAVEKFGKTKSFVLFRSKQQAIVCFEKEEDAKKLKKVKFLNVKSVMITVADKGAVSKEQRLPSHSKSCSSGASTSKTAKSAAVSASRTAPANTRHKGPSASEASKIMKNAAAAKGCGKGLKTATKSKSLLSKSKTNATLPAGKKVKGKLAVTGAVKKAVLKKKGPLKSKNAAKTGNSKLKPKPVTSDTEDNKSAMLVEETEGFLRPVETTLTDSTPDLDELTKKLLVAGGDMKEESVPLECTDAENQLQTGNSKLKPKPVTSDTEDNKSAMLVEETEGFLRPVETTLTDSTPDLDKLAENLFMAGGNVKEESMPLKCTDAENQPQTDDSTLKPKSVTSETVYNKSAVLVGEEGGEKLAIIGTDVVVENADRENQPQTGQSEDTSALATSVTLKEIVQGDKSTAFDHNPQTETVKHIKTQDAEPMQLGETDSTDLQEVSNGAILKEEKSPPLNISEIKKPAAPPIETPPPVNPAKASQHVEENLAEKAQPTAGTTEIKTEALYVKQSGSGVKTQQEGAAHLLKTPSKASSVKTPTAVKKEVQQLPKCKMFQSDVLPLTDGETIANFIDPDALICFRIEACNPTMVPSYNKKLKVIQITSLPFYNECRYTEKELAEVLMPFGFQYTPNTMFVLPQVQMAFAIIPTKGLKKLTSTRIAFKKSRPHIRVIPGQNLLTSITFYKSLMSLTNFPVRGAAERTIFIKNISLDKARELCNTWKKHSHVVNFLPLLNKAYIQFSSNLDADRFGVWHSLKEFSGEEVFRQRAPNVCPAQTDIKTAADNDDVVAGVTIPPMNFAPPKGSSPPYWITRKNTTLFPTAFPWFIIPDYLTVSAMEDIQAASSRGSMFSTIMLTNLPMERYMHENIAQVVWPYFSQRTFKTLCYNVIVLPLQKRAFVIFEDWSACCRFVQDHIKNPVCVADCTLTVHFVFQRLIPEYTQEVMYTSLIKLSETSPLSEVPEPESLRKRLLCIETTQTSLHIIGVVIERLALSATFVRYLPLANRIYAELAKASDLEQVLEKFKHFQCKHFEGHLCATGFIIKNPETLESFEKRLEINGKTPVNLGQNAAKDKPPLDEGVLKTIKVTIHQNVGAKGISGRYKETDDFTSDALSPSAIIFDKVFTPPGANPNHRCSSESRGNKGSANMSNLVTQTTTGSSHDPKTASESAVLKKAAANLSEAVKAQAKPSFSDCRSKNLREPSSSSGQKTEQCEKKSVAKQTDASSDCTEKASIQPQPEQPQEKRVDLAVALSDHRGAEESTEVEKEQQVGWGGVDGEKYQILDSFEEQTDPKVANEDQWGSSLTQPIEPGVTVDDEGKTHPQENDDMSVDVSVPKEPAASAPEDVQSCVPVPPEKNSPSTNICKEFSSECLGDAGKTTVDLEEDAVNVDSWLDKDILKTIKVTIHQSTGETSRDEEEEEESFFEEQNFSMEDFVTVDEVGADVEDTAPEPPSPSTFSSSITPIPTRSSEDSKSSILEDQAALSRKDPQLQYGGRSEGVKDQPETAESENDKDKTIRRGMRTRKYNEPSKMDLTSTTSEGESPLKQMMVKKYDTRGKVDTQRKVDTSAQRFKKDKEVTKEMELEEDAQNATTSGRPGRRRSARGKKDDKLTPTPTETSETPITDEETLYKILDSVDEETPDDEAKVTRSTRGKRERANKNDALRTPARRRHTAAREAREGSEKKLPEDQETPSTGGDVTGEVCHEDATYKIQNSVKDEVVEESPAPTQPRKRGRPKKIVKTKKEKQPLKDDASEKLMKQEEELYQVIDSVEDETADDQLVPGRPESSGTEEAPKIGDEQTGDGTSVTGSTKNQEEEQQEPPYQLVDSVITEAVSAETEDTSTCPTAAEASHSIAVTRVNETVSNLGVRGVSAAGEGSGTSNNSSRTERDQEDKPGTKSKTDPLKPEEESQLETPERNTLDTMVNLDEVSEEEENYPDDTAEEEELRKRPADSKEKHERKLREKPRTSTRAQRSRSQEDRGGDGSSRSMDEEREEQDEDSVEEDTKELLTLDEVGADEPEEERATESRDKDDITETELQSLVTLDEVVEEDDKMVEQNSAETHPLREEDQSVDFLNPETLVTIDEAGGEDKEEQEQKHSGKRKLDTETDEVGEEEEEKISPRARGRPRKRTRQTPVKVRRSVRGKNVTSKDEEEKEAASVQPATSPEKDESSLSTGSRREPQKTEVKATSAEPQPGNQKLEGCLEGDRSRTDIKAANKQRRKLTGPEAKRACSQSPGVRSSFRLPELKPNNPLGQEFVVPTSGFFCNLCLVFYRNEKTAREVHCSSQRHYDNLQKHYQKIEQKLSSSSSERPRGGPTSD